MPGISELDKFDDTKACYVHASIRGTDTADKEFHFDPPVTRREMERQLAAHFALCDAQVKHT
jgi:hypothetical protein